MVSLSNHEVERVEPTMHDLVLRQAQDEVYWEIGLAERTPHPVFRGTRKTTLSRKGRGWAPRTLRHKET